MANNLYWVGGSGQFSDPTHWSLSSGGVGGAGVPTQDNNVYFDANSFTAEGQTVDIDGNATCKDMIWTNAQFSPVLKGHQKLNIYGIARFIPEMTIDFDGHMYINNASDFFGGGQRFEVVFLKGMNIFNIYNSNTFGSLIVDAGATVCFESGIIHNIEQLKAQGLSSNLINLLSTVDDAPATIRSTKQAINVKYCTLKDIWASGGAEFNAIRSIDNGNNSGWKFADNSTIGQFAPATTKIAGLMQPEHVQKVDSIAESADDVNPSTINGNILVNNEEVVVYTHPATHNATEIVEDADHRFTSDTEKARIQDTYTKSEVDAKVDVINTSIDNVATSITKENIEGLKMTDTPQFEGIKLNGTIVLFNGTALEIIEE